LQANTPASHVSILLPCEQPLILQSAAEAPLQSTTQSVRPLQSKVHVHPLPHLNAHEGAVQSWLQHPLKHVEQSVPHIPLLLLAVELDAELAPPAPALLLLLLLIPLLVVKLPPIPAPLEALEPLVVVVPADDPLGSNWSKSCVQPT
jgi:hypothetical protein